MIETYKEPGNGAVEFARTYVEGLRMSAALPVIQRLMAGELHDAADKRVKRCAWCNYWYRDRTKPNTSITCCRDCKTSLDTFRRREKREIEALLRSGKRKEKIKDKYYYWHEYPFWAAPEYEMHKHDWKYDKPFDPRKVEQISAARERYDRMGGRMKPKHEVEYHGDDRDKF